MLSCSGLLFIKLGGSGTSISLLGGTLKVSMDIRLLIGLCCYIFSFFLFTYIIQKQNLSYIYPISAGVVNIISVILGILVLKEEVSIYSIIGTGVVILGIILMNIR